MANRIMLNETSYHGAGAIQEIATEAKARAYQKSSLLWGQAASACCRLRQAAALALGGKRPSRS